MSDALQPPSRSITFLTTAKTAARKIDAILNLSRPMQAVQALDAREFHALIQTAGLDQSMELIELASGEQVQALIDFDGWNRDRLEHKRFADWMMILLGCPDESLHRWFAKLDLEPIIVWMREHAQVFLWEEDRDLLDCVDAPVLTSPDGTYAIMVPDDGEPADIVRMLLDRAYAYDLDYGRRLLEAARWELSAQMEEEGYRFRNARLEDLGFVGLDDAAAVYARIDLPAWAAAQRRKLDAGGELVPTPVGDNLARLRYLVFPILVVAAGVQRWRPRLLVVLALVGSFAYGALPDLYDAVTRTDSRPTQSVFWQPAVAFLDAHQTPDYRVEVVQTAGRWEAFWIPEAGYALVRGWYRQVDLADNPVLYQKTITPIEYQQWLRSRAVRYVLLPQTKLDSEGAKAEATLLRSGTSGLEIAAKRGAWTIYELPDPTPLMTGPGTAKVLSQEHDMLRGTVTEPGLYTLRVRWMPYWATSGVIDCIQPGPDGQTVLRAISAGGFGLKATQRADLLVERIFDAPATDATCTP